MNIKKLGTQIPSLSTDKLSLLRNFVHLNSVDNLAQSRSDVKYMKKELLKLWKEYLEWAAEDAKTSQVVILPSFEGFMGWIEQTQEKSTP